MAKFRVTFRRAITTTEFAEMVLNAPDAAVAETRAINRMEDNLNFVRWHLKSSDAIPPIYAPPIVDVVEPDPS